MKLTMIQPKMTPSKNYKNLSLSLSSSRPIPIATTPAKKLSGPPSEEPQQLSYYDQGPVQVLPGLYLGGFHIAQRHEMLARLEISCILNVAHEIEPPPQSALVMQHPEQQQQQHAITAYHHLRWTHTQNDLARRAFLEAIQVLEHAHRRNIKVLVHCQSGIERSAALLIAYVLHLSRQQERSPLFDKKLSLWEAYDYVRERAPAIRPNMELLYQLSEFERLGSSSSPPPPSSSSSSFSPQPRSIKSNTRPKRSGSVLAPRSRYMHQRRPRAASVRVSSNSNIAITATTDIPTTGSSAKEMRGIAATINASSSSSNSGGSGGSESGAADSSAMLLVAFIALVHVGIMLTHTRKVSQPQATVMSKKLCLAPSEPSTPMSPLFLQSLFPIY
ncbi:protein-tyrosine phosphatase-like protein [Dichotomocladium elegans]|nr:protein-tyrosine phosphatase-like protein [Dichotomocladium elegans]